MTVWTITTFPVIAGEEERFGVAYREGGLLQRAAANPGFLGGRLLRINADSTNFVAIAEWRSTEDYELWRAGYDQLPVEPLTTVLGCLAGPIGTTIGEVVDAAQPLEEPT